MPKLDERITTLEGRLAQLKAQQQQREMRRHAIATRQARKAEIRRQILVGTVVLARVEQGLLARKELAAWLGAALTRVQDRALFDLEVAGAASASVDRRGGSR